MNGNMNGNNWWAITVWPEWAWAICTIGRGDTVGMYAPKDVENRGWARPGLLPVGSRLLLHAGKNLGGRPGPTAAFDAGESVGCMFRQANPTAPPFPWSGRDLVECQKSAIVAVVTIGGYDREQRTGWDVPDAWHWRFSAVEVLTQPILCSGAQGLWRPSGEIAHKLRVLA